MTKQTVTSEKALEALHIFTSLATSLATPTPTESFAYRRGATPADSPYTEMTFFNSVPALAVWLFLVTNPAYLDQLDTDPDFSSATNLVTPQQLAAATNLLPETVTAILNVYASPDPALSSEEQASLKSHFRGVAQAFDTFTQGLSANWPVGSHCPGNGTAIRQLATEGATVDPNATSFPAFPGTKE